MLSVSVFIYYFKDFAQFEMLFLTKCHVSFLQNTCYSEVFLISL